MASTEGASRAPNAPCTVRAMTSIEKLTDAPPMAEASAKPTSPVMSVRLRPTLSPIRPPRRSKVPKAKEYAVTIHWRSAFEKCRSRCAVGRAMFTMVLSRITINWAIPSTPRIHHRRS